MKDRKSPVTNVDTHSGGPKPAKLGRDVQAKIGQQLRDLYGDVVEQGVPDRFVSLLDKIDGSSKKDKTSE